MPWLILTMMLLAPSCSIEPATTTTEPTTEVTGAPEPTPTPESTTAPDASALGWRQLPEGPLQGRMGATVVGDANQVLVVGGWQAACPPTADCITPDTPPFKDGARFDRAAETWTPIADAPFGFHDASGVLVDASLWIHVPCYPGADCTDNASLQYDSQSDTWIRHPALPEPGYFNLLDFDDRIVAFSMSDETLPTPDFYLDREAAQWVELPNDPLAPVYDRSAVTTNGLLYVFGSALNRDGDDATKLAAVYDPASETWTELPESMTLGYQAWAVDSQIFLNPHFQATGGGGVFNTETSQWEPFPDGPDAATWNNDLAGLLGNDEAVFEYDTGWLRDTTDDSWVYLEPRPDSDDQSDETVAAVGPDLFVFGGQQWTAEEGGLLTELWMWTKPATP